MDENAERVLKGVKADILKRAAAGDLRPLTEYTAAHPVLADPPYLIELVLADAGARLTAAGPLPNPAEYAAMFPRHYREVARAFDRGTTPFDAPAGADDSITFLDAPSRAGDLGRLGKFRVLRKIAEGGMGVVFAGIDPDLGRNVAIKVIRPSLLHGELVRERFRKEAQAVARLDHPNVIQLFHVETGGPVVFQVMPLLKGETLDARLAREGRLGSGDLVHLARGVASGLACAHAAGLVHRDIKPSNIWWLQPEGEEPWRPVVFDFGLVQDADSGGRRTGEALVGTPAYMSPEQAESVAFPVGPKSDLFSLGVVLYEAATGEKLFERGTPLATVRATAEFHPQPLASTLPDLPPRLAKLIHDLLKKHPADRPASAQAVLAALGALDPAEPANPSTPSVGMWRWRGAAVALAAVVVVLGVVAATGAFRSPAPSGGTKSDATAEVVVGGTPTATADVVFVAGPGRKFTGSLREAHTLPARPGDKVQVVVRASAPAYLYVFAVTCGGEMYPLYPWRDFQWGTRRADERPAATATVPPDDPSLPLGTVNAWEITKPEGGMETVVVVVRTERWALPDDDIRKLFDGLTPNHALPNEKAFVAFDNGDPVVTAGRTRDYKAGDPVNAPQLQIQHLLARRLQPHAAFTTAVSFAKVEK